MARFVILDQLFGFTSMQYRERFVGVLIIHLLFRVESLLLPSHRYLFHYIPVLRFRFRFRFHEACQVAQPRAAMIL